MRLLRFIGRDFGLVSRWPSEENR